MSGIRPGFSVGGGSLPAATGAGELPVSDGAGTAYTAVDAGDVVDAAIASVVGAVAGQAIVGDGAGDIARTSADVSAMLAAANAAAARAALGVTSASHTSGTLAARPASPAAGDTYAVTSGTGEGDVYGCDLAGAWRLLRASARPLDANHVHAWRCDDAAGSTSIAATAGGAAMTLTGSAWVFGEPRLYRETGCATMEAGCAAGDRATASITMPSGSLTVECDFSLHPAIAIADGASQAPLLYLRNTDDSRKLYVMLSWSGAAGLYAGMNADGHEFGTNSTRVLSTLRLGYSVPRHLGVVLDTAATALMIYVDGQLYVTQVNAHAVGFGSTGWTASVGSALGNTATPLSIGNLRISNVARDAAYMRAAHAALRGRQ